MSTPPPPPKVLASRFDFGPCLGRGESGTVYRAETRSARHDLPAGSTVAVKVLRRELLGDAKARARLRREGELGRRIDSPHVVTIWGVDEVATPEGPLVYLVSEYVEGRTLRQLLAEHGVVFGDLPRRIGEQAALGLAALHEAGIVHRDVKPENLLITEDDAEVRVMDLGLAHRGHSDDPSGPSSGGFRGSLAYAAPEILRGRAATPAGDLYSLGVVLFELLTGQHPFPEAETADEMLHAHLELQPPPASHLEPRVQPFLEAVVAELLRKEPGQRPWDAAGLASVLAAGTASEWWRAHVRSAPELSSRRRLGAMRRSTHTEFVDRTIERRRLDRLMELAMRGRGSTVQVVGARGSGRRRLLDESIGAWIQRGDGIVFHGGQAERETTSPLASPFPQIVRDAFLPGEGPRSPKQLERLTARLLAGGDWEPDDARRAAEVCVDHPASRQLPHIARAHLLCRAVLQLVDSQGPTVLRIDRAEELDRSARLVVDRLLEASPKHRLLLVMVAPRPFLPGASSTMRVGPLDQDAFVDYGRRLFRDGEAPLAKLESASRTFSGAPGLLLESLEDLVLGDLLQGRPGDFHQLSPDVTELAPARSALARLRDRIQGLPAEFQHVLQAAAVLGRRFVIADLAALVGRTELDVLDALSVLDGRLTSAEGGYGRFRHRDYRKATLAAAEPDMLRRLHRTAAWVLEDRGAARLDVGLHLSRALEHDACLDPLLDGLESLVAAQSRRRSQRVIERLDLHLGRNPDSEQNQLRRLRWRLLTGRTWSLIEAEDKAERIFREANLQANELGRPVEKAQALVGLADLAQTRGRFLSAVQLLEEVEQVLRDEDGDDARIVAAQARLVHGRVIGYGGQALTALRLTKDGLNLAPPSQHDLRAHLWVDLARWQQLRLRFLRALESLDQGEEEAVQAVGVTPGIRVPLHRGRILSLIGAVEEGDQELAVAHDLARRYGNDRMRGRACLFRAEAPVWTGAFEQAIPFLHEAHEAAEAAGDRVVAELATVLLQHADRDQPIATEIPLHEVPILDITTLLVSATRLRLKGDDRLARELLGQALDLERDARVHVVLRLALFRAAGRRTSHARLVKDTAERLTAGTMRRRFLAFAQKIQA